MTSLLFMLALSVRASIVLHLAAPPDTAFPFFDPVNETKWDPDWKPQLLANDVQEGLVFLTTDRERGRATWLLDRYDPREHVLRYVVSAPRTLDQIDITVVPDGEAASKATVTYTRTSLERAADQQVRAFGTHFPLQKLHWEGAINAALTKDR